MKVACEYCGHIIDTDKDKCCSHCGAKINDFETIKEWERIEREKDAIKKQEAEFNNQLRKDYLRDQKFNHEAKKISRIMKYGIIFVIVTSVIISVVNIARSVFFVTEQFEEEIYTEDTYLVDGEKVTEKYSEGSFGNPVSNNVLSVTIDEREEFESKYGNETDGYRRVKFHFVVKNETDEDFYDNTSVKAYVNGIECDRTSLNDEKKLPEKNISPDGSIDGYLAYLVPENTETVEIKYGENIKILVPIKLEDRTIVYEGGFDEFVSTKKYAVKVDEVSVTTRKYTKPNNGYSFKRFHIVFENKFEYELRSNEKFVLLADGIQCEKFYLDDVKDFSTGNVAPGAKTDGYLGFEVPDNAEKLQLKYGNNIAINLYNN